jgi:hypothetical protein
MLTIQNWKVVETDRKFYTKLFFFNSNIYSRIQKIWSAIKTVRKHESSNFKNPVELGVFNIKNLGIKKVVETDRKFNFERKL